LLLLSPLPPREAPHTSFDDAFSTQGLAYHGPRNAKARKALDARKKATGSKEATPNTAASFDDAFKDARRAKVKTFTWRGKKYTTEMK
jgi:hypothetical protein